MADTTSTSQSTILTSKWDGLNKFLIASFYPCDAKGSRTGQEQIEVQAPLTQCDVEQTQTWQSPFEHSSPDTKAPALSAMLQSGAIANVYNDLRALAAGSGYKGKDLDPSSVESTLREFQGRTGITKANSTQIYTGSPPLRITLVALFRAYKNPEMEVERCVQQLWSWSAAQELSADSLVKRAGEAEGGVAGYLSAILPSKVPQMIGFKYKRRSFGPMVIESIGEPMNSPINQDGFYTEILVPMTICSLTALDKADMNRIMNSKG